MKGPFSESPRPRAYLQGATAQRIVCADYRGLPPSQRPTRGRETGPDEQQTARLRDRAGFVGVDKRQQLEAEQDRLATELARLTEAIAAGGGVTLVGAANAREAQLESLRGS